MQIKTETYNIWLVFLILFGSVTFSFYTQWLGTTTTPSMGIIELMGHGLLLFVLVFLYCLGTTAFFFRKCEGGIVSPVLVWLFVYVITLFVFLNQSFNVIQDFPDVMSVIILIICFGLSVTLLIGVIQQGIIRSIFGFFGDKHSCYYKKYSSKDSFKKIKKILIDEDWLYYINRLRLKKQIESNKLHLEAYDVRRGCHLFFFLDELDKNEVNFSFLAYVKNSNTFSNFIDCPKWCKELTDNIISIIKDKGVNFEKNKQELENEKIDFALKKIKPIFSWEIIEKVSLPLFLLPIIVLVGLSTHYVLKLEESWTLGIVSAVLAFGIYLFEQYRRK